MWLWLRGVRFLRVWGCVRVVRQLGRYRLNLGLKMRYFGFVGLLVVWWFVLWVCFVGILGVLWVVWCVGSGVIIIV